jgi:hypothetical protein
MSPFPKTDTELTARGYKFENTQHCRGCNALIEFWLTPKQKHIPLNPGTLEPHWATCPNARDFRTSMRKGL